MVKAEDLGDYYRIPADNRDLNYAQFFSEGIPEVSKYEEYHSNNTRSLDIKEMKKLLLKLSLIRKDIKGEEYNNKYPE
jgi:UDP-N-acetylglucosamine 4,6-dehydratase